ncbi:hypothetical protein [Bradyrhizobium sp. LMTR 3]|uniref:hypothetical protein n=1 Tax=Bradyrhizobium sp. LMTR 3 TaxID=189873 RepID=UPI00159F083D|nr:hypothetical protein [Bradyrhizobium sp. LMTR 3]
MTSPFGPLADIPAALTDVRALLAIDHRTRLRMVAREACHRAAFARPVGFAHATDSRLICGRAQVQLRQDNPDGKSLLIFRNRVKPKKQKESKIFRLTSGANHRHNCARLTHGGALANVTNVRWDAVDARGAIDVARRKRTAKSCGSGAAVLALSSLRSESFSGATEAKEPFSGKSTK